MIECGEKEGGGIAGWWEIKWADHGLELVPGGGREKILGASSRVGSF